MPAENLRAADWHDGLPVLVGPGVTLREPRLSDAPALLGQLTNEQVMRFISKPPSSVDGFEQFICWSQTERHARRCVVFAIVPDGQTDAAGLIQMRQLEPGFWAAEWGFALGQAHWGSGLFMESARLAVDFAVRRVGVHRLEARAAIQNGRGNGVLHKLGAVPEGVLRKSFIGEHRSVDQVLWSLLRDDWLARYPQALHRCLPTLTHLPERVVPGHAHRPAPDWAFGLPVLESDGLRLRELRASDTRPLFEIFSDHQASRFLAPSPSTLLATDQFIDWTHRQREIGRYACFGVVPNGCDHAIGMFQLRQVEPSFRTAEWGFLLDSRFWGSGAFARSASLVLDFAFHTVGVRRLEARAALANGRGNGALRKIGAVREGCLRRSFLLGREYFDDALWAILSEDWDRRPGATS